jgi:hypothetical protein
VRREVVKDPRFESACEQLFEKTQEADDAFQAVEWLLARETDFDRYMVVGVSSYGDELRALRLRATATCHALTVYFVVKGAQVHLIGIRGVGTNDS